MGSLVAYESRLELTRILLADFDTEVTAIAAQLFLMSGFDGGCLCNRCWRWRWMRRIDHRSEPRQPNPQDQSEPKVIQKRRVPAGPVG